MNSTVSLDTDITLSSTSCFLSTTFHRNVVKLEYSEALLKQIYRSMNSCDTVYPRNLGITSMQMVPF